MRTVHTYFSNHFDLVWRRCWDREYDYPGGRYTSYRRIRVAVPAQSPLDTGDYSIPAGWLRRARYEQEVDCLWSPSFAIRSLILERNDP